MINNLNKNSLFIQTAKYFLLFAMSISAAPALAQTNLSIELLWSLGRLSPIGMSADNQSVNYTVAIPNIAENKSIRKTYQVNVATGATSDFINLVSYQDLENAKLSPDGKKIIFTKEVPVEKIIASDKYADLPKSNAYIFTTLNNRHWDTYEDGSYSHVFVADVVNGKTSNEQDIMQDEMYDCPQKPSGGAEDILWSSDGKSIIYVTKKKHGTDYATSTNTDIYEYELATKKTNNLSQGMMGYDVAPAFSPDGRTLAWLSMKRDGFESDKQDVILLDWLTRTKRNITSSYDETIGSFMWSNDGKKIFMEIPYKGTIQLFETSVAQKMPSTRERKPAPSSQITQITKGEWDVNGLIGQSNNTLIVTRSDMNHANEIYTVDLANGSMKQLTHINDAAYNKIKLSNVKSRVTKASDGSDLFSWVIYPPDFDATKKYPTLLYCQGGPQGTISQFYSFRWNFQLMASQGYIVIVPNRRGCQGWGTKWNEAISKDWGGQAIQDYLSAFDDIAKEKYVDSKRCGAVGASYGGYSVFMLAGLHNNRFKSFIAHDGLFDLRSWYGNTEELWFANFDIGGPYWDKSNDGYTKFNPATMVDKWNTPIMIVQGGKDFRVGNEQGFAAFQTAQLKGIKSKLLYLPEENHWVLKAQNAQVWQREFYSWLKETL
jgi:dipeptidyl aminopeptidase/acylaminoacyl peptidase